MAVTALALCGLLGGAACNLSSGSDDDNLCNGYDRPIVVPTSACDGNVLVTTTPACAYDKPPTVVRIDCASEGEQCDPRGLCARPCDSNADCASTELCSATHTTPDGRHACGRPSGLYGPCEPANPLSCATQDTRLHVSQEGLSCLQQHRLDDPAVVISACGTTCASNADCGSDEYCSSILVTTDGTKVCAFGGGYDCDPSNPQSCFPDATCKPTGRQVPTGTSDAGTSRAEYACGP